jgi:hypothetical protein
MTTGTPAVLDRIGDTIGFCHHSSHCTNANESNIVFAHVPRRDAILIHRLCIFIKQHPMARWRQRLEQKHPKRRSKLGTPNDTGQTREYWEALIAAIRSARAHWLTTRPRWSTRFAPSLRRSSARGTALLVAWPRIFKRSSRAGLRADRPTRVDTRMVRLLSSRPEVPIFVRIR